MSHNVERFEEISKFGVIPSPSGPGAVLLHDEVGGDCIVVLRAHQLDDKSTPVALVTFSGCVQSLFGYPNDEAYSNDPRGELSYGFFEGVNSDWPRRLSEYNKRSFPEGEGFTGLRHFFVGFHDASAEFLAEDIGVELFHGDGFQEVLQVAMARVID